MELAVEQWGRLETFDAEHSARSAEAHASARDRHAAQRRRHVHIWGPHLGRGGDDAEERTVCPAARTQRGSCGIGAEYDLTVVARKTEHGRASHAGREGEQSEAPCQHNNVDALLWAPKNENDQGYRSFGNRC